MSPQQPVKDLFNLFGKVALVTGGGRNIGASIAKRLAEAGASVALTYHQSESGANAVCAQIKEQDGKALAIQMNISQPQETHNAVKRALQEYGRLDILINNAGIFTVAPALELPIEDWDNIFNVNVRGAFVMIQAAAKRMTNTASIVNICSTSGLHPIAGTVHYNTSKAALQALTKNMALELASLGIRVNCVAPGLIDSEGLRSNAPELRQRYLDRVPLGRIGEPIDVADAVLFFASPASRWITGQTLVVDGGIMQTELY